jgi:molybdate transport system substrate-binding protein
MMTLAGRIGRLGVFPALAAVLPLLASGEPLIVAAAADITLALEQLNREFAAQTGSPARLVFGSTGLLAHQIRAGAPFDVFLAADERRIQELVEIGKIEADSLARYATGRIALLAPTLVTGVRSGQELSAADLGILVGPEVRQVAIANPEHAPYGIAARDLLQRAGLWERLRNSIIMAENIRQAVQFVDSGNAEAGIVALPLVIQRQEGWRAIDERSHAPIVQAAGIVKGAPPPARAFLALLLSERGQAILKSHGFGSPDRAFGQTP